MKLFPNKILMIEDNPDDVIITKRVIGKASEECEIEVASIGMERYGWRVNWERGVSSI